jgi:hypothetical protein
MEQDKILWQRFVNIIIDNKVRFPSTQQGIYTINVNIDREESRLLGYGAV